MALNNMPTKFISGKILEIEGIPSIYTVLFNKNCKSTLVKYV